MKIGLIGCGKQAPKHLSGLVGKSDIEIVLADNKPERAKALAAAQSLSWVDSVDSLFDDPEIDGLVIATPTPTHVAFVTRALENGKHVFCEKPLAKTAAEARQLVDLAKRHERQGTVGFIYRYAPVFEIAHELCQDTAEQGSSAALGRVVTAVFRIGGRGSHELWKHRVETDGGAINEMLVHMLDLAIWFFGPVARATLLEKALLRPEREIRGQLEKVDAEDFVLARMEMANGVTVYIQADMVTPAFSQMVEIQGENGSFRGSIEGGFPSSLHCLKAAAGYSAGNNAIAAPSINLFERQMEAFVAALRGTAPADRNSLRDSLFVLEAIDALLASGHAGGLPATLRT